MPEFNVREVRLPELHLPEIKRDEIVRSLSGVRLPAVALPKARPSVNRMPEAGITPADLGRLLAAGAALARFARPAPARRPWPLGLAGRRTRLPQIRIVRPRSRRSRRPVLLFALLVAAVAGLVILRRPAVRVRVDSVARGARQKVAELRRQAVPEDVATGEPVEVVSSAIGVDSAPADQEPSAVV
jgi:hypothetical protein